MWIKAIHQNRFFLAQSDKCGFLQYQQNKALTVGVSDIKVEVGGGLYVSNKDIARPTIILGVVKI